MGEGEGWRVRFETLRKPGESRGWMVGWWVGSLGWGVGYTVEDARTRVIFLNDGLLRFNNFPPFFSTMRCRIGMSHVKGGALWYN